MNLNYAIFRSEPIMTMSDLRQIGSHNNREKQAYNSNPDIKLELSKDNIELVPINTTYTKGFKEITKEYEKEHNERMKTERKERKRTFTEMLNKSRNVVADELLFTATHKFFDNMTREDIINWANTCMDFVYEDLGYKKEQVLHSVIHLDEETPHLHCVVIPLVKKLDKRTNTERYTISKKQYIKDKIHLSELQDKYHQRLTEKGYDLERGIKNSDTKHQKTKELKKTTRYYENKVKNINKKLDIVMNEFDEKMKTTKKVPFSKTQLLIEKDTFDSDGRNDRFHNGEARLVAHGESGRTGEIRSRNTGVLRNGLYSAVQYRQHERHAFALAYSCGNDPRKLRKIRRIRGVPRNGYDGIHRRGAFVSGTKFAEADCAYGFTEADR